VQSIGSSAKDRNLKHAMTKIIDLLDEPRAISYLQRKLSGYYPVKEAIGELIKTGQIVIINSYIGKNGKVISVYAKEPTSARLAKLQQDDICRTA